VKVKGLIPPNILRLMPSEERRQLGKAGELPEEALARAKVRVERDLQYMLASLLNLRGIAFMRQRMDKKATGTIGWPDFTFAVDGRAVAWEVKLPGEKPTAEQEEMHQRMRANGWTVEVITSVDQARSELERVCDARN
jgi:hypothetical protein